MSQVTEQSVRFQTALASIKLIQASAVLDLTEDDFRSEERFSRNAETDLVCRLLLEKKKKIREAISALKENHDSLCSAAVLCGMYRYPGWKDHLASLCV